MKAAKVNKVPGIGCGGPSYQSVHRQPDGFGVQTVYLNEVSEHDLHREVIT